jgi:hypothetical protein
MQNPSKAASITTTGTATPTPIATAWLFFFGGLVVVEGFTGLVAEPLVELVGEDVGAPVDDAVGFGRGTPLD